MNGRCAAYSKEVCLCRPRLLKVEICKQASPYINETILFVCWKVDNGELKYNPLKTCTNQRLESQKRLQQTERQSERRRTTGCEDMIRRGREQQAIAEASRIPETPQRAIEDKEDTMAERPTCVPRIARVRFRRMGALQDRVRAPSEA